MPEPTGEKPIQTIEQRLDALEEALEAERERTLIAESVIAEYRQALAASQFALAQANAKLKLATKPTA